MSKKTNEEFFKTYKEGGAKDAYLSLGAHAQKEGVLFTLYAPNAVMVGVVGDFNAWNSCAHKMEPMEGFWQLFVKGIGPGERYKYEITTKSCGSILKADPFARESELRPNTASVVPAPSVFTWSDGHWFEKKSKINVFKSPINLYEVHLGSWKTNEGAFFSYRQLAPTLTNYLLEMGYNYVEIMPLCEYPLDDSWGYQTTGYYSVTRRYGSRDDLKYLIDMLHGAGIGVILDWVPAHFCKDAHGLYHFDGETLYENENPLFAENEQWGTANFDFSKPAVQSFLISNALFWFLEYHVDGLRVDAVANMIYFSYGSDKSLKNEQGGEENLQGIAFLRNLNRAVYETVTNPLMIAEDSSAWPKVTKPVHAGGLGFTFKWNMGWMNDMLCYMETYPTDRKFAHNKLTFSIMYTFSENYILPLSHDEMVHGKKALIDKMPGAYDEKFPQIKMFLGYMYGHPGKKLLFMGSEIGQFLEWRFYESIEWNLLQLENNDRLKIFVRDLNFLYKESSCLWEKDCETEGFSWIDCEDRERSIVAFLRQGDKKDDFLIFLCNFTAASYERYTLGVPRDVEYEEVLNSDNVLYGGNNKLNRGFLSPKANGAGSLPYSVELTLASFGLTVLKPRF